MFSKGKNSRYDTCDSQFQAVLNIWEVEHWTFESLRRVQVETIGERQLDALLRLLEQSSVEGPIDTAPATLIAILRDRVGERVTLDALRRISRAWVEAEPRRSSPELVARAPAVNEHFAVRARPPSS